ncbi:TorF family putative porin, partial [Ponticaulis sp.]|uniref:TorF family putative porin n=1 Tax=Ponticaulis sp. TaxID=2020902 RepID=UPI000B690D10
MIRNILLAGAASVAVAAPAVAQEVSVSGNVAIGTEYVWRGVTQSNGDMAISGGFDLEAGNFYAGTWVSNVDFEDSSDTNIEWDFYAGFTGDLTDTVAFDLGLIYYAYP